MPKHGQGLWSPNIHRKKPGNTNSIETVKLRGSN